MYDTVVRRTLQNGTTCCCYFGTLDLQPSLTLARTMDALNQRGFVGKVAMDRLSPDDYVQDLPTNLDETEALIAAVAPMRCVRAALMKCDMLSGDEIVPSFGD